MTEPNTSVNRNWRCKECGRLYGNKPTKCDMCNNSAFQPLSTSDVSESFEGDSKTQLGSDVSELIESSKDKQPTNNQDSTDKKYRNPEPANNNNQTLSSDGVKEILEDDSDKRDDDPDNMTSESYRRSTNSTPQNSPTKIVNEADGSFSKNVLTQMDGRVIDQRLIDYLTPEEELKYVFWHRTKGLRIIKPNGSDETPHHDASTAGSRFLLVTDKELVYIAGINEQDELRTFSYEDISDIDSSKSLFSSTLTFTVASGIKYRFAETGTHASDIEDAANYIRQRVEDFK